MTKASDLYNHELYGLPIEKPAILNINHLEFLRYLGECGRLEHPSEGPSSGPMVPQVPAPTYSGKAS